MFCGFEPSLTGKPSKLQGVREGELCGLEIVLRKGVILTKTAEKFFWLNTIKCR